MQTGQYHTLALMATGEVWCAGANYHGECGVGHSNPVPIFERVTGGGLGATKVAAIAAGSWHSVALTEAGATFGWGLGSSGQLGPVSLLPGPNASVLLPAVLPAAVDGGTVLPVVAVAAGDVVTLVAA